MQKVSKINTGTARKAQIGASLQHHDDTLMTGRTVCVIPLKIRKKEIAFEDIMYRVHTDYFSNV